MVVLMMMMVAMMRFLALSFSTMYTLIVHTAITDSANFAAIDDINDLWLVERISNLVFIQLFSGL